MRLAHRLATATLWWAVLILVMVIVGRAVVAEPFKVGSASMEPTLLTGRTIWVWKLDGDPVQRGEVVAFDGSDSLARLTGREAHPGWFGQLTGDHRVVYIKRVIGVGGDRVRCCTHAGRLEINGTELSEPYVVGTPSATTFDVRVPAGRVWVMGDNRDVSSDSRSLLGAPGGGTIREDRIVGRVMLVTTSDVRSRRL